MLESNKKYVLKEIEICKEAAKNNFDICCETYTEIISILDRLTYVIQNETNI